MTRQTAIRWTFDVRRRRRAYILLVVLAFTALASSLGMSFLEANSTVMPEAVNYTGMIRAETMASSGIGMAAHFLLYPPTNISLSSYYTGANGVTIDSSGDYYDVTVARSDTWSPAQTDLNLYRVTATGVAKDPGGAIRAKRLITAEIQAPPIGKWQFTQGFWSNATLYVPSRAFITGDVHSNGNITANGSCTGRVSATGAALWTGGGPPSSVTSGVANLARPFRTPYQQSTYVVQGNTYSTYSYWWKDEITQSDATFLNSVDMSSTNPGRIIIARNGDFKVRQNVQLNGTLVVNGNLRVEDAGNHQITAVQGFPSLLVVGDIQIRKDNSNLILDGSVITTGTLDSQNNNNVGVTVTGTFFADNGMDIPKASCTYNFNWSSTRSEFWDIQNIPPAPQPMTILSWKEN